MRKKLTDCIWFVAVCRILSIVLFLLLWELLVNKNVLSPLMFGNLPAPSGVAKELVSIAGTYCVADDIPPHVVKQPVHIYLNDQQELVFEALQF